MLCDARPCGTTPQVLSIGETVEEVNDSGFDQKTPTIKCQLMADDSMLQACAAAPSALALCAPVPHMQSSSAAAVQSLVCT